MIAEKLKSEYSRKWAMFSEQRRDRILSNQFPIRIFSLALVLTFALIAGLSWYTWDSLQGLQSLEAKMIRLGQLEGEIARLDEVLTMSARQAVSTGDPVWEERYRLNEPQLSAAISEAAQIAPDIYSSDAIAMTDEANVKLVEMENQAFSLIKQGNLLGATAILDSPEYARQKLVYANGEQQTMAAVNEKMDIAMSEQQRRGLITSIAATSTLIVLSLTWFLVLQTIRGYIADRNRALESLKESQEMSQQAQRVASLGHYVFDIATGIWTSSEILDERLGIDAGYIRNTEGWLNLVHPEQRDEMSAYLKDYVLKGGNPFKKEYRIIRPIDRAERWLFGLGSLELDSDGLPVKMFGTIQDITERKLVEEAMRDSEEKYRTLFEQSKDGIVIGTPEGKIQDANSAIAEMLGYSSRKELLELDSANELYDRPEERDALLRIIGQQGFVKNYEVNMKRRDGSSIVVSMSATPSRDEKGKVVSVRSIIRDMTTHRLLEQQLIESQKLESIGRLAGGVAHDFNNFLTAILGYIDLAVMETSVGDEAREDLAEARAASERAANLARQLLLFSRREPVEMKPVNLNDIVGNLLKMLGRLIGEQYSIKTDLAEDLQIINGDPGHLEQVLMNLVVNARDATSEGGTITLRARNVSIDPKVVKTRTGKTESQFVELSVTDTGKGMDAETVSHIFEPFFSTKGAAVGTGLGLSVVYGIITQHGGWIDVDSAPDRGSTFSIYFSAIEKAVTAGQTEMRSEGMTRGHGERILLVEDEDYLRKMVEKIMTESGYAVVAAATAEEAERAFIREKGKFDLIFSDVILPGKDGVWLVKRLHEQKRDLPILMASGYSDIPVTQAIRKMGYTMMQKPYDISELMRVISSLMKSPPTKV